MHARPIDFSFKYRQKDSSSSFSRRISCSLSNNRRVTWTSLNWRSMLPIELYYHILMALAARSNLTCKWRMASWVLNGVGRLCQPPPRNLNPRQKSYSTSPCMNKGAVIWSKESQCLKNHIFWKIVNHSVAPKKKWSIRVIVGTTSSLLKLAPLQR